MTIESQMIQSQEFAKKIKQFFFHSSTFILPFVGTNQFARSIDPRVAIDIEFLKIREKFYDNSSPHLIIARLLIKPR